MKILKKVRDLLAKHSSDPKSYQKGFNDCLKIMADREKKALETLKFYENVKNFGVTVWADETQDGDCWYEPAKDHGLGEIYERNSTGDFGIKAWETLDELNWKNSKLENFLPNKEI